MERRAAYRTLDVAAKYGRGDGQMASPTEDFFAELKRRGHEPALAKANGTVRFELTHGRQTERWLVTMADGDVTVARRGAGADAVVRVDQGLFDRIVTGEENAMAAILRGAVGVEGDLELMMLFQRALPAPPAAAGSPVAAGGRSS
jgi:putative sterol carrier protein